MRRIRKISELQPTIGFTAFDIFNGYRQSFLNSEPGKLHKLIPFARLAQSLGLKDRSPGRDSYFSPEDKVGLMILKSYTSLSDRDLITQLNANIHYQLFCGVRIHPLNPLTGFKTVSEIRCQIGKRLDMDSLQQIPASCWKPYMDHTPVMMTDATMKAPSVIQPM